MIHEWINMRRHLVERHREHSAYLSDTEVDRHYTGQRRQSIHHPSRYRDDNAHVSKSNIHMNTTEFTDVLSNMTNLISTNIQQGTGTTLNTAAYFNNMSLNSRCNFPMYQPANVTNQHPLIDERPAAILCRSTAVYLSK